MIKLKLSNSDFKILVNYITCICKIIKADKAVFIGNKRTTQFMQLNVQLYEMEVLKRKLDLKEWMTRGLFDKKGKPKVYSFSFSPTQGLLFIFFISRYQKLYEAHPNIDFTLQTQVDIIMKELITK